MIDGPYVGSTVVWSHLNIKQNYVLELLFLLIVANAQVVLEWAKRVNAAENEAKETGVKRGQG